ALMSSSWTVSVLIGPLVGGLFAHFGNWRSAFVATAAIALAIAIGAFYILPPVATGPRTSPPSVPSARIALICLAIAGTSSTTVLATPFLKLGGIAAAIVSLAIMLRLDRRAPHPLLPSDAFSPRTQTGVGLWLALLLCITFSPLQIF